MGEIVLPEDKPAWEWVRGRALQKVSPRYRHARLQMEFASQLATWAKGRGRCGTEWDFRLAPPGEVFRPLVPDVAYLSYERLPRDAGDAAEIPRVAPDFAVEILSPGDLRADVEDKIGVYLACGTNAVVVVDPKRRSVRVHTSDGATTYTETDTLDHPNLGGFTLALGPYFATIDGA